MVFFGCSFVCWMTGRERFSLPPPPLALALFSFSYQAVKRDVSLLLMPDFHHSRDNSITNRPHDAEENRAGGVFITARRKINVQCIVGVNACHLFTVRLLRRFGRVRRCPRRHSSLDEEPE